MWEDRPQNALRELVQSNLVTHVFRFAHLCFFAVETLAYRAPGRIGRLRRMGFRPMHSNPAERQASRVDHGRTPLDGLGAVREGHIGVAQECQYHATACAWVVTVFVLGQARQACRPLVTALAARLDAHHGRSEPGFVLGP